MTALKKIHRTFVDNRDNADAVRTFQSTFGGTAKPFFDVWGAEAIAAVMPHAEMLAASINALRWVCMRGELNMDKDLTVTALRGRAGTSEAGIVQILMCGCLLLKTFLADFGADTSVAVQEAVASWEAFNG